MGVKLTQKGRWVYITPDPPPELEQLLTRNLSYTKKDAQFMPNPQWGVVKLYQEGRKRFPVGLLERVKKLLDKHEINYEVTPQPLIKIKNERLEGLRPYQEEAVKALWKNKGGILSLPTGAGKTHTALRFITSIEQKTLVVVPTIEIKTQWEKHENPYVVVRTYQSVKSKSFVQSFRCIVFDECHMVAAKTLQLIGLNAHERAVIVGLSATPMMRDDDNLKVESVLGPIVFSLTVRELIDDGFLVDAIVHYHSLKPYQNEFMNYHMMYDAYVVDNKERNNKVVELVSEPRSGFCLVLVDKVSHGLWLEELLKRKGVDARFIHGNSKDREDVDYRVLVATSIYDMGVDIPRLETLVLAGGGKSSIKTVQRAGRVLRLFDGKKNAVIHDFVDRARWLFEHYKERRKIFEEQFRVIDV